jgi:hypothetical protein
VRKILPQVGVGPAGVALPDPSKREHAPAQVSGLSADRIGDSVRPSHILQPVGLRGALRQPPLCAAVGVRERGCSTGLSYTPSTVLKANKGERRVSGQAGNSFVGGDDVGELVVEAGECGAMNEVGGEDLTVGTFAIEGGAGIANHPGFESEVASHAGGG